MKSYFVYMVRCADGSFYTGITNNVEYRVGQHNFGTDPESYTFARRPVRPVYVAEFHDVIDAIQWEKHVKKWSHAKKQALAAGDWNAVRRLARCRSKR
ncbi:MAG: GIY-YIG nuclease family protein [Candidatus Cybelea sp.]